MYHINYEQSHPTTSIRRRPGINTPVLDPQYTHPIHSPSLYTARKFASPTGHTTSPITLADSQTFYPQIPQLLKPVDLLLKKGDNCQVSSLPSKYPDYPSLLSSRTWSLVSSDIHSSSNLVDTKVASAIFSRKMTHKYPQYVPAAQDGQAHHTEPWTLHKWFLMFSVSTVFVYGLTGLVCALSTWLRAWRRSDVLLVTDSDIIVLITSAALILLVASLVGITGTILNSRPLLAIYALLLWPALIALAAIGYASYKRYTYSLDRKLDQAWSRWYTPLGRLVLQDALICCGYQDPNHTASPSPRCFPRAPVQGCKAPLLQFERDALGTIAATAFALVPLHLVNIIVSLLCANHVSQTFGRGVLPFQYRLGSGDLDYMRHLLTELGTIQRPRMTKPN